MIPLKIETLYGGGAVERLQEEIQRVIANICDPNTPAKKVRKIKLELVVKPNEQRNMAEVVVNTSSTLCPPEPLETSIYIGNDPRTGEVAASEITSGEDPNQNLLPDVKVHMNGKITRFPDAKTASSGN